MDVEKNLELISPSVNKNDLVVLRPIISTKHRTCGRMPVIDLFKKPKNIE